MAGGYQHRPTGVQAVVKRLQHTRHANNKTRRTLLGTQIAARAINVTQNNIETQVPPDGGSGFYDLNTSIDVPAGYTQALVSITAAVSAVRDGVTNPAGQIEVQPYIADNFAADDFYGAGAPLVRNVVSVPMTRVLTGLSDSFVVGVKGMFSSAGGAWQGGSGGTTGRASISGLVVFLR